MGVQHLWSILAPVKTHCPLEALQGKTLAVDLSVWVCEASGVRAMTGAVTRPHLRNLFFRVSHLTRMGIHLIFVVDGDPPELKFETMMKRNQARFGGSQKCTDGQKKGMGLGRVKKMKRSHFKAVLKECILLLDGLGIPHVQSKGEAEAFCALLNKEQLVDGCLTDDGDAFVYGARTVYRNLTLDKKDPHVECYNMADIEDKLLLDQNKLVGLALLLGCDYCPKGVPGVGKELAVKVMTALGTCDVLERFRLWRSETPGRTDQKEEKFCCDACGYTVPVKSQGRIECELCGTPCELKGSKRGDKSSVELTVMRKALVDPNFPDTKIIKEFLVTKDSCPTRKLEWRRPSLLLIQDLNLRLLEWPDDYTLEKALPLVTYWEMTHMPRDDSKLHTPVLAPYNVVKTRTRHGVSCLEVQWYKPEDVSTADTYLTTVEPEVLFTSAFPQLVQDFWDKAAAQKSKKKGGKSKSKQRCTDGMTDTDVQNQDEESQSSTSSVPSRVDNSLALDFSKLSLDTLVLDQGASDVNSTTEGCKEDSIFGSLRKDSTTSQFLAPSDKAEPCPLSEAGPMDPNFSIGIDDFSFVSSKDRDSSFIPKGNTCTHQSCNTSGLCDVPKISPNVEGKANIVTQPATVGHVAEDNVMLPLMARLQLKGKKRTTKQNKTEKIVSSKDGYRRKPLRTDCTVSVAQEMSNQDGPERVTRKDRTVGQMDIHGGLEDVAMEEQLVLKQSSAPVSKKSTDGLNELQGLVAGEIKEGKGSNLHSGIDTDGIGKKTCLDSVPLFDKQVSMHRPNAVQCDCTDETSVINSTNEETSVPDSTTPNKMTDAKEEMSVVDFTAERASVDEDTTKGTIVDDATSEETPILNDATEETSATDNATEETSVLDCTAEETLVLYDTTAETSVLDEATEESSVVDDVIKETYVLDDATEETSVLLDATEKTSILDTSGKTSVLDDTTKETSVLDDTKGLSAAYVPCDDAVVKPTSTYSSCSTSEEKGDVNSPGITKLSLVERLRLRVGHSKGKVLDAMHHTKHSLSHASYCD